MDIFFSLVWWLEIDRYGFFGADDADINISAMHGLIADTNNSYL